MMISAPRLSALPRPISISSQWMTIALFAGSRVRPASNVAVGGPLSGVSVIVGRGALSAAPAAKR